MMENWNDGRMGDQVSGIRIIKAEAEAEAEAKA
jgi:hypothetical protein